MMTETMVDNIKIALALLLLTAGVVGFYLLADQAMILRVLSVLAGLGAGIAMAATSAPGRRFIDFGRESVAEAKKVAWPTRRETIQTTGIVFAFVLVMAIMLWVTDKTLEWVLYDLLLGWKK
jgi:preprotein translocase subunit SecE